MEKLKSREGPIAEPMDVKAVNYTELIPLMIKGMQEQDKIIKEQSAKIDALTQFVEKVVGQTSYTGNCRCEVASS